MKKKEIDAVARELDIKPKQIKAVIKLLNQGNTVPFIARYRKEKTGNLNGKIIRQIDSKRIYVKKLRARKKKVIEKISDQDELTADLKRKIEQASVLKEVEDLYRPFKKKRKTRASRAKEQGLEPFSQMMLAQKIKDGELDRIGANFLKTEIDEDGPDNPEQLFQGARDIISQKIADDPEIRQEVRDIYKKRGKVRSIKKDDGIDKKNKYQLYYDYSEKVTDIPPHRILAVNRGEDEQVLKVKIEVPREQIIDYISLQIIEGDSIFLEQLEKAVLEAYNRLLAPAMVREMRSFLTEKAAEHSLKVFGNNLRSLLLQPPLRGKIVLGVDPGFRSGCKVCVVDEQGHLLDKAVIYPHSPQNNRRDARKKVVNLIQKNNVDVISLGNGTASRESELFLAEVIQEEKLDVNYTIVNEAGASVYSASEVGRSEFPELETEMRGAVSIARRLQDPLAELVKINPRHLGIGLYQHDLNPGKLEKSLGSVVEDVVNFVGVDLNTASVSLLQYVAGFNSANAQSLVDYRKNNGPFMQRQEIKEVYGIGPKTFTQAAGFLRLFSRKDPLAATPIHPEVYAETEKILEKQGFTLQDISSQQLKRLKQTLKDINIKKTAELIGLDIYTVSDIVKALKKPGRDPREDREKPIFKKDVLKIEDLQQEMILKGRITNIVDFGVFVDIGLKQDGLVHISEMSSNYVENPHDLVSIGQVIKVRVLDIEKARGRISLSMII